MIKITEIETPLGKMVAGATGEGICLLEFADRNDLNEIYADLSSVHATAVRAGLNWNLWKLRKQLREYFTGKRKDFTLKLLTAGTGFQKSVWEGLRKIPYGETISYQDQAAGLKNTGAARAVAQANASNRIAIIIPCHRVIGADGSLVGYGGGLARKKWLLDHERKHSGKAIELDLF
ncbi:MAG TPA: methylated-DNA--[protein]-cysteine S-methyltransferase [Bacteroidales bacterium]|nr:methylated-DNA--[protein]-cysteine S-methyltransferase [Bacteroidales bacterium]HPF04222.1 methylated-DNA--[protein]-cysteine S-methyltransferase [Bacteroidales bacterium]HPJ60680.1 methylated-DNA--[protein]-cysteine S-methyltransferase [Bacteroidales bacterium]HPR12674.1 methylated-DNA--[protein]-cysteine S-methyltransferase [Bacteroidales bacterium]HRW84653.1 methylated-DNA--[protein]-cysteine S-methyltransferase [Bacteroidales bacterium]